MIIPYSEIQQILNGCYIDDGEEILVKHSVYKGEREFAIALIERCMGLLSKEPVNDKFIVQYLQGLLSLTCPENKHYEMFLNTFVSESLLKEKALDGEKLSKSDIAIIRELMLTNMAEYTMKGGNTKAVVIKLCLPFFKQHIVYWRKRLGFMSNILI